MVRKIVFVLALMMAAMTACGQSFVWFTEPDEIYADHLFKVRQIWSDKYALAVGKGDAKRTSKDFNGNLVLLVAADGSVFYDDQTVDIKRDKIPLVVGVFRYTSGKQKKTIPVVAIKKKEKKPTAKAAPKRKPQQKQVTTADGLIAD
jgi:hypothetical protein